MKTYEKSYKSPEEYSKRFQIFRENSAYIRKHNSEGGSFILGVNSFADLSFPEFSSFYLQREMMEESESDLRVFSEDSLLELFESSEVLPSKVDWRKKDSVRGVKDQGKCGSCWAFAATGTIESAWHIKNSKKVTLSEQQLVDCSKPQGNKGCEGGLVSKAFKYIMANGGLTGEKNYPYKTKEKTCNTEKSQKIEASIKNFKFVQSNNSTKLMKAVAKGPVAVQVDSTSWHLAKGGIITEKCGIKLNHAVVIVGYDQTHKTPFWIIKNSWGKNWNEDGYIRVAISNAHNNQGLCGINTRPIYPVLA
jgi:C1A family cysteine protease